MKRAYLVLGPESSGTRMMTEALISAGCHGDAGARQRWDKGLPHDADPVVWRRSVPHRQRFPPLVDIVDGLRGRGYRVRAVVTTRDWSAMLRSQVAQGHVTTVDHARDRTRRAYLHIFGALQTATVAYVVASYESIVQRPRRAMTALLKNELGLPAPDIEIYDANEKWFEEVPA